ncbi:MAG TPA: DUF5678 domain-containing protein [Pyrinomonadaceae bacterium]|nr:DUF5678 domain-containing protein [Pyrinomonadaceae bacterium]
MTLGKRKWRSIWNLTAHKIVHKKVRYIATLEQLIEDARRLPTAEKRRLRDALDRELQSAPTYPTHERESAWIEANRDQYLGQWVALDGDKLLAHGRSARTVYEAAKAAGASAPFLERIKPKVEAFMGGWQ